MNRIHPVYQKWLGANPRDPEDASEAVRDLNDNLFRELRYHSLHLCVDTQRVEFKNGVLVFKDGLSTDLSRVNGQCAELSSRVHLLLGRKYPRAFRELKVVDGKERTLFDKCTANHLYLEASSQNKSDSWIIDPALKRVVERPTDDYQTHSWVPEDPAMTRDLRMGMGMADVLFKTGDTLVYFGWINENPIWQIQRGNTRDVPLYFDEKTTEVPGVGASYLPFMKALHKKIKKALKK